MITMLSGNHEQSTNYEQSAGPSVNRSMFGNAGYSFHLDGEIIKGTIKPFPTYLFMVKHET